MTTQALLYSRDRRPRHCSRSRELEECRCEAEIIVQDSDHQMKPRSSLINGNLV